LPDKIPGNAFENKNAVVRSIDWIVRVTDNDERLFVHLVRMFDNDVRLFNRFG